MRLGCVHDLDGDSNLSLSWTYGVTDARGSPKPQRAVYLDVEPFKAVDTLTGCVTGHIQALPGGHSLRDKRAKGEGFSNLLRVLGWALVRFDTGSTISPASKSLGVAS